MNYIGKKYSRLIIKKISNQVINGYSRKIAICNCSCGIENKEIRLDGILEGAVKSCGCYSTEVKKQKKKTPNPMMDLRKRLLNSAKVRANKDNFSRIINIIPIGRVNTIFNSNNPKTFFFKCRYSLTYISNIINWKV